MKSAVRASLFVALTVTSTSFAADWSQFRGPNGSGRGDDFPAQSLPVTWSNEQGVAWKVPVSRGSSSPVISGKQIFVTGYTGYAQDLKDAGKREDLQLHVLSYDADSGKLNWDYQFPASKYEQAATQRIADHGYASPTPCTDGRAVYASFGPSGIVALDLQGKLLWRRDVGHGTAGFGAASSPIEFQNLVIVNASIESDSLLGLDKQTGDVVWTVKGVERAWTTPALVTLPDGSVELVIHYKDHIRGFSPETGKELWSCAGIPDYIVPLAVSDGERVFFSGGRQNRTTALKAGGRGNVTDTHKLWEVTHGANVTSPLFHDGHLYWSHDKGFAQCVDAATGKLKYQERFRSRDRVYASVIYGDHKFYMTQRDGTTLALEARPDYKELATNKLGDDAEQFNATPAIHEKSLLFRSTKHLYRIQRELTPRE